MAQVIHIDLHHKAQTTLYLNVSVWLQCIYTTIDLFYELLFVQLGDCKIRFRNTHTIKE